MNFVPILFFLNIDYREIVNNFAKGENMDLLQLLIIILPDSSAEDGFSTFAHFIAISSFKT